MKIAFDIDDTLIIPSVATSFGKDSPNRYNIKTYKDLQKEGHHMILWSGTGIEWASYWNEKLKLRADEIRIKQFYDDIDICYDDCTVNLAKQNIKVKRINNSISRKEWNKTKHLHIV